MRQSLYLAAVLLAITACTSRSPTPCDEEFLSAATLAAVENEVEHLRGLRGESIQYGVWLSNLDNSDTYAIDSSVVIPAASSVKPALLIEFFSEFSDQLDAPFPATENILSNAKSPAVRHFDVDTLHGIRADLHGLTVREIGEAMISKQHVSSNASYNAASNLVIAALGGTAAATQKIHARHPQLEYLEISRYMLADRNSSADNATSLSDLAVIHRSLASRSVPGLSVATIDAIRSTLEIDADDDWQHFYKGGTLSSDPQVRIEAGWLQSSSERTLIYAIAAGRKQAAANPAADIEVLRNDVAALSEIAVTAWSCHENQSAR